MNAVDAAPAQRHVALPRCGRAFGRRRQQHSCKRVSLESHFEGRDTSRPLFDHLLDELNVRIGRCEVVSLPCCIHLYGEYEFLAALPRRTASRPGSCSNVNSRAGG